MKRRTFLAASTSAVFAPSISFGAAEELRVYYPYSRRSATWTTYGTNVEGIFRKHFEGQIEVKSYYQGELEIGSEYDAKTPVDAIEQGIVDLALVTNELHFQGSAWRNGMSRSSLFLDHGLGSVEQIDAFRKDKEAWKIFDEVLEDQEAKIRPLGSVGQTGLGWFRDDVDEVFNQATAAAAHKSAAPVMLTDYGWADFWDGLGFMPLNLEESAQYRAASDNHVDGRDHKGRDYRWLNCDGNARDKPTCRQVAGAQAATLKSANQLGYVELWKTCVLPEAFGAPSMQYLAMDRKRAFDEQALFSRVFGDALKMTRTDLASSQDALVEMVKGFGIKVIDTPKAFKKTGRMFISAELGRRRALSQSRHYVRNNTDALAQFIDLRQKYAAK